MSDNTVVKSLFAYKAWANAELFGTLANVPPQEFAQQLHSCVRTLNHIYVVDQIFRAHLSGHAHGYVASNTPETPSLDALQSDVCDTDAWYLQYASQASEAELDRAVKFRFTDGDAGCMTVQEILLHVITRGGYHRGNVGQVLKSISVAPPRDLLTKFLHQSEPQRRAG